MSPLALLLIVLIGIDITNLASVAGWAYAVVGGLYAAAIVCAVAAD
ncbi:hypothetical protein O4215_20550 [Rhodococcus maanshanensis]|nr:hypothetical protein [Rhodococcus maanshanensis]MCZ4557955.1 hypothetical protein [Rhodococcus maanshanensis]